MNSCTMLHDCTIQLFRLQPRVAEKHATASNATSILLTFSNKWYVGLFHQMWILFFVDLHVYLDNNLLNPNPACYTLLVSSHD